MLFDEVGESFPRLKVSKIVALESRNTSGGLAADGGFADKALRLLLRKGTANDFTSSPFKYGLQTEGKRSLDGSEWMAEGAVRSGLWCDSSSGQLS